MFSRKAALKNFASCTGKHLFWDRFLIKCRPSTIPTQVFSCKNYRFFSVFTDPILLYIVTHQGIFFVIVIVFLIALLLFNGHKVQQQLCVYILYCIFIFIFFVADVCNTWKLFDRKKKFKNIFSYRPPSVAASLPSCCCTARRIFQRDHLVARGIKRCFLGCLSD